MRTMSPMEFAVTIGIDALRIATGHAPRHHDVDTICRWLRHVSKGTPAEAPPSALREADLPAVGSFHG